MDFSDLQDRLLFAIPKKGRLHEQCLQLLQGADIQFHRKNRLDIALSTNLPIALVFLNASDIAKFVGEGNVDIGITGQDMIAENGVEVLELLELGFGKCALQVLVPNQSQYTSVNQLIGTRIVTSFENIVNRYSCLTSYFLKRESGMGHEEATKEYKIESELSKTKISYVNGSVEAACALGLADGIVDLVESGETMRAAKLHPIATLLTTQAVFIANPHKSNPLIATIKRRIQGVIVATRYVLVTYNIQREKLHDATIITPGKRAPTVAPHDNGDWVSVSSMVSKKDVVEIMDKLEAIGADDILVTSIQNCRVVN